MKEIIEHNNKKIVKTTKQNGDVSYSIKGVYIGTDVKTGKRITKTITARTLKALDRKIVEAKIQFEKSGSTVKETIQIDNFESLAEIWFSNFKTWVSSQNTISCKSICDNDVSNSIHQVTRFHISYKIKRRIRC